MIIFLYILLLLVSVLLIMVILVQRGRGGGLAGAFGSGGGSSSAFGTKTGDVFTTLTVVTFVVFMLVSIALSFQYKYHSPPNPPREVSTSSDPTADTINLQWTDDADNEKGYRVLRNNVQIAELPANSTKYTDTNLEPNTKYTYSIQVYNDAGPKNSTGFDTHTAAGATSRAAPSSKPGLTAIAPEAAGTRAATTSAPASAAAGTGTAPASAASRPAATGTAPMTPPASMPATTPKP